MKIKKNIRKCIYIIKQQLHLIVCLSIHLSNLYGERKTNVFNIDIEMGLSAKKVSKGEKGAFGERVTASFPLTPVPRLPSPTLLSLHTYPPTTSSQAREIRPFSIWDFVDR